MDKTLEEFPPQIKDVYIQTWTRILNQAQGKAYLAINALAWVLYAERSLTVDELRHAIATCPDTYKLELSRLSPAGTLLSVCCGLITLEGEAGIVRLVRESFRFLGLKLLLIHAADFPS